MTRPSKPRPWKCFPLTAEIAHRSALGYFLLNWDVRTCDDSWISQQEKEDDEGLGIASVITHRQLLEPSEEPATINYTRLNIWMKRETIWRHGLHGTVRRSGKNIFIYLCGAKSLAKHWSSINWTRNRGRGGRGIWTELCKFKGSRVRWPEGVPSSLERKFSLSFALSAYADGNLTSVEDKNNSKAQPMHHLRLKNVGGGGSKSLFVVFPFYKSSNFYLLKILLPFVFRVAWGRCLIIHWTFRLLHKFYWTWTWKTFLRVLVLPIQVAKPSGTLPGIFFLTIRNIAEGFAYSKRNAHFGE